MRSPQDEDFHDLIAERYERSAIIVTSNLDIDEWGAAFPNKLLGAATIDRLRDGAYRVILDGESHRLRPSVRRCRHMAGLNLLIGFDDGAGRASALGVGALVLQISIWSLDR